MPVFPDVFRVRRVLVAAVLVVSALPSLQAAAAEGEHEYGAAVGGGFVAATAPMYARLAAQYLYNVGDLWSVGAVAHAGIDNGIAARWGAFAETRIIIDALQWVPSLTVGAGVQDMNFALRATAELAWRPTREGAWFARLTSEFGGVPATTGVEVGYRFIRGAASDLDF